MIRILLRLILPAKTYARFVGVKIGVGCRVVSKNFGSEPYLVEIGNHVHVTKGVSFVTHDGSVWIFRNEIPDLDIFGKIRVKDNTYIGNNSVILPGVTIGSNCIVGANSVVTKSIPDNCVIAGSPAKFITNTKDFKDRIVKYNAKTKKMKEAEKKKVLLSNEFSFFIEKEYLKIEK